MNNSTVQPQLELAIVALVLGILSFGLSFMIIGGLLGIFGLVIGLIHLGRQKQPRGMAISGMILSAIGILACIGFGFFYYNMYETRVLGSRSGSMRSSIPPGYSLQGWEGVESPDFTVTSLNGEVLTLNDLKGKRVLIDIWATWCGPCVNEIPHLEKLNNETSRDDLVIIGISNEDETKLRPFASEKGITYPIVSANNLPSPYKDVRGFPTKFFIDRNGIVQSIATGSRDFDQLKEKALVADFQGTPKPSPVEPYEISDEIDLESPLSSEDPWVGIWKFNPVKSNVPSSAAPYNGDSFVKYHEINPDTIEITLVGVSESGSKKINWRCTVPKSGGMQMYQQGGSAYTIVDTVIDDHTQYLTYLLDGKQIFIRTLVLSENGRTYTLSWKQKNTEGEVYEEVQVFEKQ